MESQRACESPLLQEGRAYRPSGEKARRAIPSAWGVMTSLSLSCAMVTRLSIDERQELRDASRREESLLRGCRGR